ncbi:VOC family protein [candidate division WOR-3 bacterium]|nr:VOC family protein [candidate division WOR-3 bacterium]
MFENIDCVELYVSDLDRGIKYYCGLLGLDLLWRAKKSSGLKLPVTRFMSYCRRKEKDECRFSG